MVRCGDARSCQYCDLLHDYRLSTIRDDALSSPYIGTYVWRRLRVRVVVSAWQHTRYGVSGAVSSFLYDDTYVRCWGATRRWEAVSEVHRVAMRVVLVVLMVVFGCLRHAGGWLCFRGFWGVWFGRVCVGGWVGVSYSLAAGRRGSPRWGGSGWPSGGGLRTQERVCTTL